MPMSTTAIAAGENEKLADTHLPTNRVSSGHRGSAALALLIYTGLAVAMFYSTWVVHPTTWSIGGAYADSQEAMWFLGWPPFALTHGQSLVFTNYIDYPGGVNLLWNGSMLLVGLVLAPLTQLAGFVLS